MAREVLGETAALHDENRYYFGTLVRIDEEEGNYGPQLVWKTALDEDGTYVDDDGVEKVRLTYHWTSVKLTTNPRSKFRKTVKTLTGKEPVEGEMFYEEYWTRDYYKENPGADPVELTGVEKPWRVALMFEHGTKSDGSPKDTVIMMVGMHQLDPKMHPDPDTDPEVAGEPHNPTEDIPF